MILYLLVLKNLLYNTGEKWQQTLPLKWQIKILTFKDLHLPDEMASSDLTLNSFSNGVKYLQYKNQDISIASDSLFYQELKKLFAPQPPRLVQN